MALCPICGCKTDELDFVNDRIAESEVKICSFCQRQIHAFDEGKEPGDGHLRWLASVADKEVSERPDYVGDYLAKLKENFVTVDMAESVVAPKGTIPVMSSEDENPSYTELLERVEALEIALKDLKRKARIKTILEICVPIMLGIVILLVFLSSDLFDSLSQLYNFFV